MPSSSSTGSTLSSSVAWSRSAAHTATCAVELSALVEGAGDGLGLVAVRRPGDPGSLGPGEAFRRDLATDHGRGVGARPGIHRVGEEEAGDDEDVLVLGELDALGLARRGDRRVDRREDRLDLAAVDAAVGVDVVEQGLVDGPVVAEVEVEARRDQRLHVDEGDPDLDRVIGDARCRSGDGVPEPSSSVAAVVVSSPRPCREDATSNSKPAASTAVVLDRFHPMGSPRRWRPQ